MVGELENNPGVSAATDDAGCEEKDDEDSFKKEICSYEALPITNLGDSKVQTDIVPQGWLIVARVIHYLVIFGLKIFLYIQSLLQAFRP